MHKSFDNLNCQLLRLCQLLGLPFWDTLQVLGFAFYVYMYVCVHVRKLSGIKPHFL